VSPQGPSPTQHQQYPKIYEPWTTQALRSQEITMLDPDTSQPVIIETALSPTSSNERSSRRQGPLSAAARKNANLVRQLRACRRCVYMKETVSHSVHRSHSAASSSRTIYLVDILDFVTLSQTHLQTSCKVNGLGDSSFVISRVLVLTINSAMEASLVTTVVVRREGNGKLGAQGIV
jgi:hypothetical protein